MKLSNVSAILIRAGVIPAMESASESDFGSFWTTNLSDSGSGSFTLESLESAPVLEPIQTVKIAWKSPFLLCENWILSLEMIYFIWNFSVINSVKWLNLGTSSIFGQILTLEPIPLVEPIPDWNRLQLRLFFSMESAAPAPT